MSPGAAECAAWHGTSITDTGSRHSAQQVPPPPPPPPLGRSRRGRGNSDQVRGGWAGPGAGPPCSEDTGVSVDRRFRVGTVWTLHL